MTPTLDVTDVVWLRRRLARGALATKVASVLTAIHVGAFFDGFSRGAFGSTNPLLLVISVLLTGWLGFRVAGSLQVGSRRAGYLVLVMLIPYVANSLVEFDWYNSLFKVIAALPIYFILMAGLALPSARAARAREFGKATGIDPFRPGVHGRRRPPFARKLSWGLYVFLALLVLVPVLVLLSSVTQSIQKYPDTWAEDVGRNMVGLIVASSSTGDPWDAMGQEVGALLLPLLLCSFLYRRARRHSMMRATDLARRPDRGSVILYLRSFADDQLKMRARAANGRWWLESILRVSFEEIVVDHLWQLANVVAIGRPGEKLAPLGAAREWLSHGDWQGVVEQLMQQARLIVMVVGRSQGVTWELSKLIELRSLHKLVLLIPPARTRELEARWTALCTEAAHHPELGLPERVEMSLARAVVFPGNGRAHLITGLDRDDWAYETVLDLAAEVSLAGAAIVSEQPRLEQESEGPPTTSLRPGLDAVLKPMVIQPPPRSNNFAYFGIASVVAVLVGLVAATGLLGGNPGSWPITTLGLFGGAIAWRVGFRLAGVPFTSKTWTNLAAAVMGFGIWSGALIGVALIVQALGIG